MKSAKVDAKGFTTLLWLSSYGRDKSNLPQNFCNFFWESVLSYVLAIFAWPGHLINLISKTTDKTKAIWWSFHILIAFLLEAMYRGSKNTGFTVMSYLEGMLIIICLTAMVFIMFACILFFVDLIEKYKGKKERELNAKWRELEAKGLSYDEIYDLLKRKKKKSKGQLGIVTWWKAFKGKYCPKIEWENLEPQKVEDTSTSEVYDND